MRLGKAVATGIAGERTEGSCEERPVEGTAERAEAPARVVGHAPEPVPAVARPAAARAGVPAGR